MLGKMGKAAFRQLAAERLYSGLMCDLAQRNHHPKMRQFGQRALQKWAAGADLGRARLILWRNAAHGVDDDRASQFQPVIGHCPISAIGKAEFDQRFVKQRTGIIARKRTAGPIRTLKPRREADNCQPRIIVAEAGNGSVEPLRMKTPLLFTKIRQPRAKGAIPRRLAGAGALHR